MVGFLKKAKDLQPEKGVKFYLHSHLSDFDPARSLRTIHASELTKDDGICPRFYVLAQLTKFKPKDRWLTTSERMTYQIGRDQERNIVLWFAEMGRAICHWKCLACGHQHDFQLRPAKCKTCGVHARCLEPVEVRFESDICGASCGADMLIAIGKGKLTYVEIKTMDKEQFKGLHAPLAEHKWRTNLGLRLIAESAAPWSNLVSAEKARVLYVSKGGYGCADDEVQLWGLNDKFSPFKEYVIKRDDAATDEPIGRAKVVHDFRQGKVGIPCGVCPTAMSQRAQKCPLRAACFGGDYPPTHQWQEAQ